MDIMELAKTSASGYIASIKAYAIAGVALALSGMVAFGWFCGALVAAIAIAAQYGGEPGHWIQSIKYTAAIGMVFAAGAIAASLLGFSAWGGFLNLCNCIRRKEKAGLSEFAFYAMGKWKTFTFIGGLQLAAGAAFAIPGIILAYFYPLAGIPLALLGFAFSSAIFMFAYPYAVARECGGPAAVVGCMKMALPHPIPYAGAVIISCIVLYVPILLLPLYPAYYFLFAAPLSSIMLLGYCELAASAPVKKK